ncbi:MAG: hypothetical protein M3Y08_16100 [Fibrobacterota bacterium]|nr:hypothetical protein [Fibrobacterota bacterium]
MQGDLVDPLEYAFPGLFLYTSSSASPAMDPPEEGLAINITDLKTGESGAAFQLHLTGNFSEAFMAGFLRIEAAPVVFIQDVTGAVSAFRTIDTHKRYPPVSGPNFQASTRPVTAGHFRSFWMGIPMWVETPIRSVPSLFITATLQYHVSNTLALNLKAGTFSSSKEGKPHEIRFDPAAEDG